MLKNKPVIYTFLVTVVVTLLAIPSEVRAQSIDVWWPTDDSHVEGVQPIKAMMPHTDVNSYYMYWQVDAGGYVFMPTNYEGYPHKENTIDFSNWNWNDDGQYTIRLIAQDLDGNEITSKSINIHVNNSTQESNQEDEEIDVDDPTETESELETGADGEIDVSANDDDSDNVEPESDEPEEVDDTASDSGQDDTSQNTDSQSSDTDNPFAGESLFVDPFQDANRWSQEWEDTRPEDAELLDRLGDQPLAIWLGDWNNNVGDFVTQQMNRIDKTGDLPVFVAYNIPNRDCGSFSAGGLNSRNEYLDWIGEIAQSIGDDKAVVLLEPDAVAGADCLSNPNQRYKTISKAVDELKQYDDTYVYIDAGNASWHDPASIANRLEQAGIEQADGFALNISNFITTERNHEYGEAVSSELPGEPHFVIDTSRNGNGAAPDGEWCNPDGRAVGKTPMTNPEPELVDAHLWVKGPGGSDGECNGNLPAGQWSPELALELVRNAGWE